jgi:hypothetical protein
MFESRFSRLAFLVVAACPAKQPATPTDTASVEDASPPAEAAEATETSEPVPVDGGSETATDTAPEEAAETATEVAAETEVNPADPYGFPIRVPESHKVTCKDFAGVSFEMDVKDTDHVCSFVHGADQGTLYLQATPTGCGGAGLPVPILEVEGAWFSQGGKLTALENPDYDYGGGHNNDFLEFDRNGKRYKVYHSSFGFGFRACQPPDCLQVYDPGTQALLEDGCGPDRKLPVVCVRVAEDGSYPALVDSFKKCAGDPNGP